MDFSIEELSESLDRTMDKINKKLKNVSTDFSQDENVCKLQEDNSDKSRVNGIYSSIVLDLYHKLNAINDNITVFDVVVLTIPDKEFMWSDFEDDRKHFLFSYKEILNNSEDFFITLKSIAENIMPLNDALNSDKIKTGLKRIYTYKNYLYVEKYFRTIVDINNRNLYQLLRDLLLLLCNNAFINDIEQVVELKAYLSKMNDGSELNQYEIEEETEHLFVCFYKFFCFVFLLENKELQNIDFSLLPVNYIEYDQEISRIINAINDASDDKIKLDCYKYLYSCLEGKSSEFVNKICNDCYMDFFNLVNKRSVQDNYLFKNSNHYRLIFLLYERIYDNVKFNLYRNYYEIDSDFGLMRTNLIDRKIVLDYFKKVKSNIYTEFKFERRKPDHRIATFYLRLANYNDIDEIIKLNNPSKPFRRMIYVKSSEPEIKIGIENNSIWIIEEELDDGTRKVACVSVLLKNVFEHSQTRIYSDFSKDQFNGEFEQEYYEKNKKPFSYIDFNSVLVNNGEKNKTSYRGFGFQRLCLVLAEELAVLHRCDYICATVSAINKPSMRNFMLNSYKKESTKFYRLDDEMSDFYKYITSDTATAIEKIEYDKICIREVEFINSYYQNYNITKEVYLLDRDVPRDFVVLDLSDLYIQINKTDNKDDYYLSIIEAQKQEICFLREEILKPLRVLTDEWFSFKAYFNLAIMPFLSDVRNQVKKLKDITDEWKKHCEELRILQKSFSTITDQLNTHFSADATGMQEAEKELQEVFGESIWNRLLSNSRISLCSAHLMWKRCNDLGNRDNFDFSGICILATSALENEIKRIFSDSFQNYLKIEQHLTDPEAWPKCLSYKDKNTGKWKESTRFMLGSFQYMIGIKGDNEEILREKRKDYLNAIISDEYSDGLDDTTVLFTEAQYGKLTFVQRCNEICYEYRNKAAHTSKIDYDIAEKCYVALIPKERAGQKLNDINNLLVILYKLVDEEKVKIYLPKNNT